MSDPAQEAFEAKAGRARGVLLALDGAIRTRRQHPSDHPRSREATEDLIARFLDFFEAYAYLRVEVLSDEIRFERRTMLKTDPHEPAVPFLLFRDGIREIRFHRGISRDEVLEFLGIVERSPIEVREEGRDYVSLLWQQGFASIDFVAVDEFDDADMAASLPADLAEEVGALSRQMDRAVQQMVSKSCGVGNAPSVAGEGHAQGAVPWQHGEDGATPTSEERVEAVLDALPSASADDLAADLRRALHIGTMEHLLGRAVLALERLQGEVPPEEIERAFLGFAQHYARVGDFCTMGHLVAHLKAVLPRHPGAGPALAEITRVMTAPDLPDRFVEFINRRFGGDESGLGRFLDALGADAGGLLCKAYRRVTSSHARRFLGERILSLGAQAAPALRQLLVAGDHLLPEILDLLYKLDPSALGDDLRELLANPNTTVRMQTIALMGRMQGFARTKALVGLLEDPDTRIRRCVLKTLGEARDGGTVPFLKEWIRRTDFHARDTEEKREAFRAVTTIQGDAAAAFLQQIAMTPPPRWGGGSANETRRTAVRVLLELGTRRARESLDQIAQDGDETVSALARAAGRV